MILYSLRRVKTLEISGSMKRVLILVKRVLILVKYHGAPTRLAKQRKQLRDIGKLDSETVDRIKSACQYFCL